MGLAATRRTARGAASWIAFLALVLAAWAGLFAMTGDFAARAPLSQLGPGMDVLAPLISEGPGGGVLPSSLAQSLEVICRAAPSPGEAPPLALFAMWALMALAMMAPTALPVLRAYGDLMAAKPARVPVIGFWALLAGFCLVWLGFAALAALAQAAASSVGLMTLGGFLRPGWLTAGLLALAGLYQFSAVKAACLSRCRSPMAFFISHWRDGPTGALVMGLRQGLSCLGCCWALMALAFVGGTMNLLWMGIAMGLMAAEKLPDLGKYVTPPLGVGLLASAAVAAWGAAGI